MQVRSFYARFCRYTKGLVALIFVALCWVLEAEFLQGLQDPSSNYYYPKPYFLTWLVTSGYIGFLIPWWVMSVVEQYQQPITGDQKIYNPFRLMWKEKQLLIVVGALSTVWMFSGYTWYISLGQTSVTANTIISNTAFIWTFLFSIVLLQENVSSLKVLSCLFCLVGLVAMTISGNGSSEEGINQTVLGYILAFLATILNCLYDIIFKKYGSKSTTSTTPQDVLLNAINIQESELDSIESVGEEEIHHHIPQVDRSVSAKDTLFFLGMTGVYVFLFFWPGMIILDLTGYETFEVPQGGVIYLLIINILLDAGSNLGILIAVSITTPLFTDVGILLTIPTSIIFDVLFHHYLLPWFGWIGIGMLLIGFLCVLFSDFLIDFRISKQKHAKTYSIWLELLLCLTSAYCSVS